MNIYYNRKNNCCEGYNSRSNDFFKTKPHIFKFLLKLKDEESLIYKNYIQIEFTLFKKYKKDQNDFIFSNIMDTKFKLDELFWTDDLIMGFAMEQKIEAWEKIK